MYFLTIWPFTVPPSARIFWRSFSVDSETPLRTHNTNPLLVMNFAAVSTHFVVGSFTDSAACPVSFRLVNRRF